MVEQQKENLVVQGACVECNTKLEELTLGKQVDEIRYYLVDKVWCPHCEFWLTAAIKDAGGRYWGRRRIWHD